MEKHKEETRDARGVSWLETLVADLRYGARALLKHPGYAAAGHADARPRHRRQHRDLQRHQRRAAEAAAVRARRSPGDRAAVAAAVGPAAASASPSPSTSTIASAAGRVRRPGRIPPDELRPDQPRRAGSRQHRRRLAQLLRPARHQADPRPHVRGVRRCARRRSGAGPEPHLLAARSSAAIRTSSARCSR